MADPTILLTSTADQEEEAILLTTETTSAPKKEWTSAPYFLPLSNQHQSSASGAATSCSLSSSDNESDGEKETKNSDEGGRVNKVETLSEVHRIVLIVRTDLKQGAGKVAEQCCLATLSAVWNAKTNGDALEEETLSLWFQDGEQKSIFAVDSDVAMSKLEARVAVCGLPIRSIFNEGNRTVLAIGPATTEELDIVTEQMKLLNWTELDIVEGHELNNEQLIHNRTSAQDLTSKINTMQSFTKIEKKKIKPNSKCPCGSRKKYKKCCAGKDAALKQEKLDIQTSLNRLLGDSASNDQMISSVNGLTCSEKLAKAQRGERVLKFRKQGEYGAKKYIKP